MPLNPHCRLLSEKSASIFRPVPHMPAIRRKKNISFQISLLIQSVRCRGMVRQDPWEEVVTCLVTHDWVAGMMGHHIRNGVPAGGSYTLVFVIWSDANREAVADWRSLIASNILCDGSVFSNNTAGFSRLAVNNTKWWVYPIFFNPLTFIKLWNLSWW